MAGSAIAQPVVPLEVRPQLVRAVSIPFTPVDLDSVLHFVDVPDSAIAAPNETIELTVWIAAAIEGEDRQVRFETTGGAFEFAEGVGCNPFGGF